MDGQETAAHHSPPQQAISVCVYVFVIYRFNYIAPLMEEMTLGPNDTLSFLNSGTTICFAKSSGGERNRVEGELRQRESEG